MRAGSARGDAYDVGARQVGSVQATGRRIVSSFDRALLVRRACLETERTALEATPGVVGLLARLAREALPHLTAPVAANAGLSAAERNALMVLERYAELLQEAGCCESSQAAALLPEAMEAPRPLCWPGSTTLTALRSG